MWRRESPRSFGDGEQIGDVHRGVPPVRTFAVADLGARHVLPDADEPRGVRVRQRTDEHAVHDAEDRGVRADAERERRDRDGREQRRARQATKRPLELDRDDAHT